MIALQGVEEDSCSPEDKQRSQRNGEEQLDSTVKRELLCHLGKVIMKDIGMVCVPLVKYFFFFGKPWLSILNMCMPWVLSMFGESYICNHQLVGSSFR